LIVELSGFKKGELTTDVLEKSVTIEGTRSDLNTSMTDPIIRQSDIPIGSFKLHIPFKFEIASTEIIAEREDGFIRLTVPKKRQDQISIDI
jgi:HSP20 family molecular chaperone IbpA